MIKPTVGRVVWFYASTDQREPLAAIITKVCNDHLINIAMFSEDGVSSGYNSVALLQYGEPVPQIGFYCTWMPYQLGQAAKTEQAESKLNELEKN
jgi:hypothetical protein